MGTNHSAGSSTLRHGSSGSSLSRAAWSDAPADGKRFALDTPFTTAECGSWPRAVPARVALRRVGGTGYEWSRQATSAPTRAWMHTQLAELRKLSRSERRAPVVGRRAPAACGSRRHVVPARHEEGVRDWKSGSVKSPANCPACHTAAATGRLPASAAFACRAEERGHE